MSRKHSQFRPCIDLHQGVVKQIVGGTLDLTSRSGAGPTENFVATHPPSYFAGLYKTNDLMGGHIIKLGPGNDEAANEAVSTWRDGMQVGGGITEANAQEWLNNGASKVIVTSYLFPNGKFDEDRLKRLANQVGKDKLVVDIRYKV